MKLSISITDRRVKPGPQYGSTPAYEEYDRVAVEDADGSGAILAGLLRSIAAEIDPGHTDFSPSAFQRLT